MDKKEAKRILAEELAKYRSRSYEKLKRLVSDVDAYTVIGDSGADYQIEIEAVWDNNMPDGDLRVIAGIDDGGWRAFCPLTDDFVISPSGDFVVE